MGVLALPTAPRPGVSAQQGITIYDAGEADVQAGMVVCPHTVDGQFIGAKADAVTKHRACAFVLKAGNTGGPTNKRSLSLVFEGEILEYTGVEANKLYYLSTTRGQITDTLNETEGEYNVMCGVGIGAGRLLIRFRYPDAANTT